jgi:hypothetical protein
MTVLTGPCRCQALEVLTRYSNRSLRARLLCSTAELLPTCVPAYGKRASQAHLIS